MNISHLDKAEVLAALYNHSKQQGMGFIHARGYDSITVEEAREMLAAGQTYFDYVHGRILKVRLDGGDMKTALYDRDNGEGAAAVAIAAIKPAQP